MLSKKKKSLISHKQITITHIKVISHKQITITHIKERVIIKNNSD